jgi:hypothetical protein
VFLSVDRFEWYQLTFKALPRFYASDAYKPCAELLITDTYLPNRLSHKDFERDSILIYIKLQEFPSLK